MAEAVTTPPAPATSTQKVKPEKPDDAAFKAKEAENERAFQKLKEQYEAARDRWNNSKGGANNDTPAGRRHKEIKTRLEQITKEQADAKPERQKVKDQITKLEEKSKRLIEELKQSRSKSEFKSVQDLEREIQNLEKVIGGGKVTMLEEKKTVKRINALKREKTSFPEADKKQTEIDQIKTEISELKSGLKNPAFDALSAEYTKLKDERTAIESEQKQASKSQSSLKADVDKARAAQNQKYEENKKFKDAHYAQKRAHREWQQQAYKIQQARREQENKAFAQQKQLERAQKMLEEASDPAYLDDIRRAETVLRFLDPSYTKENAPLKAPSGLTAEAQRTVDASEIKGMKVIVKKDEEDYFAGKGGKKGKKGKKAPTTDAAPAATGKYSCPPQVMEDCSAMGIDPPMVSEEVEGVLEKVKAKIAFWKEDQKAATEKAIAKAKKEVERLNAEDAGITSEEVTNGHGHGETKATASVDEGGSVANELALEEAAVEDAAADLKAASLEDKA